MAEQELDLLQLFFRAAWHNFAHERLRSWGATALKPSSPAYASRRAKPGARARRRGVLCFSSRPFVLCGLPVRRLPGGELIYRRRKGQFVLQVTGHPDYGVPFGQDRIVPMFLATLAVQQKSQVIRFHTTADM